MKFGRIEGEDDLLVVLITSDVQCIDIERTWFVFRFQTDVIVGQGSHVEHGDFEEIRIFMGTNQRRCAILLVHRMKRRAAVL